MRKAKITRKTNETNVSIELNLDGSGKNNIDTGVPFLNHMLTLLICHSHFDATILCKGDTDVDFHHSCEDIGITLGQAFNQAIGDKKGIVRFADRTVPMDEALSLVSIDISGRGALFFDCSFDSDKIGDFDCELVEEFFSGFVKEGKITMHIKKLAGKNSHHIAESIFKAVAKCLKDATSIEPKFSQVVPSTKGSL